MSGMLDMFLIGLVLLPKKGKLTEVLKGGRLQFTTSHKKTVHAAAVLNCPRCKVTKE